MEEKSRKSLTNDDKEYRIWLKLKALAMEKQYGQLEAKIIIHDGKIVEIRHKPFESVIRG